MGVGFPKSGRATPAQERTENAKVKARSSGDCEMRILHRSYDGRLAVIRCYRMATEIHHMISGRGKRGVGVSYLAQHKQHLCRQDHRAVTGEIGGKKLKLIQTCDLPRFDDVYERV